MSSSDENIEKDLSLENQEAKTYRQSAWLLVIMFLVIVAFSKTGQTTSLDVWWLMAEGKHAVENGGQLPATDSYSYTVQGGETVRVDWLTKVLFYKTYDAFGFKGLIYLKAVFAVIFFLICLLLSSALRKSPEWLVGLGAFAYLAFQERLRLSGDLFTVLGGCFSVICLFHWHHTEKIKWLIGFAAVFFIWILGHGGWIMGGLIGACYILGSAIETFISLEQNPEEEKNKNAWKLPIGVALAMGLVLGFFQFINPLNLNTPWDFVILQFNPSYVKARSHIQQYQKNLTLNWYTCMKLIALIFVSIPVISAIIKQFKKSIPWIIIFLGYFYLCMEVPRRAPSYLGAVVFGFACVMRPWQYITWAKKPSRVSIIINCAILLIFTACLYKIKYKIQGKYPAHKFNLETMRDFFKDDDKNKKELGLPPGRWAHDWSLGSMIIWEFGNERKTFTDNRIFPFIKTDLPDNYIKLRNWPGDLKITKDNDSYEYLSDENKFVHKTIGNFEIYPDKKKLVYRGEMPFSDFKSLTALSKNQGYKEAIKRLKYLADIRKESKNYFDLSNEVLGSALGGTDDHRNYLDDDRFTEFCNKHKIESFLFWLGGGFKFSHLWKMEKSREWVMAYMDESCVIMVRNRPQNYVWLEKLAEKYKGFRDKLPPKRSREKDDAYRNFGYAFSAINIAANMPAWVQEKRLKEITGKRSLKQKLLFLKFRSLRDTYNLLKASESLTISVLAGSPSRSHEIYSWLLMMKINTHLADVAKDLQAYLRDDYYLTQIKEKDPELLELSEKTFLKKVTDAGDKLKLGYKNISEKLDIRRRVLTAHALFRLNQTEQAAEIFEDMIESFTISSPDFILPAIESFHQTGRLALAQKWVKKALAAWPKNKALNIDSILIQVDILRKMRKDKEAEALIEKAIISYPGGKSLLQTKAFLEISKLLKSGKMKTAKEKIREAIKKWPKTKLFTILKSKLGMP